MDLIVLEGPEGCGKSTITTKLREHFEALGTKVSAVREPGFTKFGEEARRLLLSHEALEPLTEFYMFQACRVELLGCLTKVPMDRNDGGVVIMDRFWPSTFAYQVCAGGIPHALYEASTKAITDAYMRAFARVTMAYLDCPDTIRLARMKACGKGGDRYESKPVTYHQAVRNGYEQLADFGALERINANQSVDLVVADILKLTKAKS